MTDPRDVRTAFASVAPEVGDLLLRLGCAITPAEALALRDRIADTLAGAGLAWNDLAERVMAPRPPASEPIVLTLPPSPSLPTAEDLEREAFIERLASRGTPLPHFGRFGVGPVPETFETIPGESFEAAGDRLASWAIARSGQPFWEDPVTGEGFLPGVTVPGRGVVRPNGTLGPLPAGV